MTPASVCSSHSLLTSIIVKKLPTWELKPHTRAKHLILRSYLEAWLPKLAWKKRIVFIDGFAGPGEYAGGEPGSPQIALDAAIKHKGDLSGCELVYIFVEADEASFRHLKGVLDSIEHPSNIRFEPIEGQFATELSGILDNIESRGSSLAPALIVADPFGWTGVPFDLIARAARQPRSEFLISFMSESIIRWKSLPNQQANFDSLFGCSEWRDALEMTNPEETKRFLIELYVKQLKAAGLTYVRTFEVMDEKNHTEYYLVFGTHNIAGLRAMKAAMWNADPSGRFQFSYASNAGQLALIALEPDFDLLRSLIVERFAGAEFSIEELEEFVLAETAFRESHYKKQILKPLELEGKLKVLKSTRKKAWSYPPGTTMRLAGSGT